MKLTDLKTPLLAITLITGGVTLAGCDHNDGPLEKAGETVDDAIDDTGDAIEEGAEEVKDEYDDATTQ